MKSRVINLTLEKALDYAVYDHLPAETWDAAERVLIEHGLCPYCACEGEKTKLLPWQAGDHENYAGRECPGCESFIVCGQQDSGYLRPDEPDLDAAGCCYSDADPGL